MSTSAAVATRAVGPAGQSAGGQCGQRHEQRRVRHQPNRTAPKGAKVRQ